MLGAGWTTEVDATSSITVGSSIATLSGGTASYNYVSIWGGEDGGDQSVDNLLVDYINVGVFIPEPATLAVLAIGGLMGLLSRKRR